jgi:hypothetical protein
MDVEKYSKTFSVVKGPFACKRITILGLRRGRACLYPFMPYKKTMAIVIWRMEVIYIHWAMAVANQRSGVNQDFAQNIIFTFTPGFLPTTLGSPRVFNMRDLNINAPPGYFPLSMSSVKSERDAGETFLSRTRQRVLSALHISLHHFKKHVGVGIICSVAYFDPYVIHLNVEDRF